MRITRDLHGVRSVRSYSPSPAKDPAMPNAELRAMQNKLSEVHSAIHATHVAFHKTPASRDDSPAGRLHSDALNAACQAISSAVSAFYVLQSVLDLPAAQDSDQRGA